MVLQFQTLNLNITLHVIIRYDFEHKSWFIQFLQFYNFQKWFYFGFWTRIRSVDDHASSLK